MYVCWFKQSKILISQHSPPQFKYFAYQNGPKGGPNENEFRYFSNTKMNITSSYSSKRRWKNGAICLVSFLIFWVMVLKLPKMVQFLPIWDNLSKESKSIGSLYSYASERLHYALSENSMFYRRLSTSSQDIEEWNIKKVLTQQKFNEVYQIQTLIPSKH